VHDGTSPTTHSAFEKKVVDSLTWVADGCNGACSGWFQSQMANHLTYGSVAHGNSQFFPWHRAYLKGVEEKMQLYNPCVTMPWWDWTIDQTSSAPHNFEWTAATHLDEGLWGNVNGGISQMGNFELGQATVGEWVIPSGWPVAQRSLSMNPTWSLPSSAVEIDYLTRTSFGSSSSSNNLKSFEGPHGSPHVMIGGNMGNGRSPADPMFWLHHAGCDRIWYDWQNIHTMSDYDADPNLILNPFTYTPNDVFDSRNSIGVCYAPSGTTVPSARRLAADKVSGIKMPPPDRPFYYVAKIKANLDDLEHHRNKTVLTAEKDCENRGPQTCGPKTPECYSCDKSNQICYDEWSYNMFLNPKEVEYQRCIVNVTASAFLSNYGFLPAAKGQLDAEENISSVSAAGAADTILDKINALSSHECKMFEKQWSGSNCQPEGICAE
jgi:tyrosinase